MGAAPVLKYTAEEYFALEDKATFKSEFYKGEIFAMAGASINHNRIVKNTLLALGNYLKDKPCEVFPSDLKIAVANSLITYPDVSIVCNELETLEGRNDTVTNPSILIEVLSPSTEDYDRGGKFKLYREIESLKEYITISSTQMYIDHFVKQVDGSWLLYSYNDGEKTMLLPTIGFTLTVSEVYANVEF